MKSNFYRIFSLFMAVVMLLSVLPLSTLHANAVTFNELNASNVFLKQAGSRTCTLCAATMMLRRYSMLRGDSAWSSITESSVRSSAWIEGAGLRWSFTYSNSSVSSISVGHYTLPGGNSNEAILQEQLKICPEGIVIYNESAPHAILLTDYTNGVYYCADPAGNSPSGRIPISSAYKVTITNVTAYWKVTSEIVPGPTGSSSCTCSTSYAGTYVCTTSSSNLQIRSGHGTSYSSIGSIPPGATVTVTKASGTSSSDWAHVQYNGITGYASMQYLKKAESSQDRDSRMAVWFSDSEMGDSIDTIRTGEWLYFCYKLYDANTGDMFDTYTTNDYTAKLTIYAPDGSAAYTYTYSNDNNYIGIKRTVTGEYKGELIFTWNSNGATSSARAYIDMVYEPRVTSSAWVVSLDMMSTNSQTVDISYSGATNSNSIYVRCIISPGLWGSTDCFKYSWGTWNNHQIPITFTGLKYGDGYATIELRDSDTDELLDSTDIYVSVTAPTYTITYNANGGSGAPSSQTKYYNNTLTLSSTVPTRSGYTFLGWSTSSSATSATYSAGGSFTSNSNTTLYAVWRANPSSLSANSSYTASITTTGDTKYYTFTPSTSGTYVIYSTGDKDTQVTLMNSSYTEITSNDDGGEGYNFRLAYNLTAGTQYIYAVKFYSSSATGSIPFKFGRVYTVSYNANGGSGAPSSQTKDYGTALTLSSTKPTRSGYTFLGWSTSSSATSATYSAGGSYIANSNATLYAVWRANPSSLSTNSSYTASITTAGNTKYYTFTPSTSGTYVIYSTGDADTKVTLMNSSYTEITSNDDGGEGYNFRLAYNLTAGTQYIYAVKFYSSSATGSIPFKFGNVYTVSYNANGGSGAPSSQTKDYGTALTLSSTKPTRSGYTFLGWSTSSSATSATYQPGSTFTVNANTTLYAVWKKGCENNNHTPGAAATCTSAQTCTVCGATITAKLGHSMQAIAAKTSTCAVKGNNAYYKCTRCSKYYKDANGTTATTVAAETLALATCTWNSGVVTTQPTTTSTGIRTYTCTVCGKTKTETIPKLSATTSSQIIISSVKGAAGDTVKVTISLKNNPGVSSIKLNITYGNGLILTAAEYNSAIGGQSQQPQSMTSPVILNWFNGTANSTGDFVFATLTFKISESAAENSVYTVNATFNTDDIFDVNMNNVDFTVQNGSITVTDHMPGDINGDNAVNNKDLTILFRYLSNWDVSVNEKALDVNGDGSVNNKDLTILFRYLSNWNIEIH